MTDLFDIMGLFISSVVSSVVANGCGGKDSISTVVVSGMVMAIGIFGISL